MASRVSLRDKMENGNQHMMMCPSLAGWTETMHRALLLAGISVVLTGCLGKQEDAKAPVATRLTTTTVPLATIGVVGMDTLSDSARINGIQPEPDGGSVAFLFADPAKGIGRALGLVEASGTPAAQLAWPDSVSSFWWSAAHQLSFTAGTGQGVRVVINAHAAQLEALEVTGLQSSPSNRPQPGNSNAAALTRAQAFIDSIRVQPGGTPQRSTLQYRADSILLAPGDTFAAVHVSANDNQGTTVNPAWYLAHLPTGHVQPIDSLTGQSSGLPSSAGQWGADGSFYYAKERSIWRATPKTQQE
jgi:hypothetical protein